MLGITTLTRKSSISLVDTSKSISEQVTDMMRSLKEERAQDARHKIEQILSDE